MLDGDTFVAEAEDVTELLGKDELINEMNKKVAFKGLELGFQRGSGRQRDHLPLQL